MTVSIQLFVEDKLISESVAVSTVNAARANLRKTKKGFEAIGTEILKDTPNCLEIVNRCGLRHRFQIVKYFTKEPI